MHGCFARCLAHRERWVKTQDGTRRSRKRYVTYIYYLSPAQQEELNTRGGGVTPPLILGTLSRHPRETIHPVWGNVILAAISVDPSRLQTTRTNPTSKRIRPLHGLLTNGNVRRLEGVFRLYAWSAIRAGVNKHQWASQPVQRMPEGQALDEVHRNTAVAAVSNAATVRGYIVYTSFLLLRLGHFGASGTVYPT